MMPSRSYYFISAVVMVYVQATAFDGYATWLTFISLICCSHDIGTYIKRIAFLPFFVFRIRLVGCNGQQLRSTKSTFLEATTPNEARRWSGMRLDSAIITFSTHEFWNEPRQWTNNSTFNLLLAMKLFSVLISI